MLNVIGAPVVWFWKTPENISTTSGSRRLETTSISCGILRSNACCTSSIDSERPAGQPSIVAPTPGPWLSPKHVTVKAFPSELLHIEIHSESTQVLEELRIGLRNSFGVMN